MLYNENVTGCGSFMGRADGNKRSSPRVNNLIQSFSSTNNSISLRGLFPRVCHSTRGNDFSLQYESSPAVEVIGTHEKYVVLSDSNKVCAMHGGWKLLFHFVSKYFRIWCFCVRSKKLAEERLQTNSENKKQKDSGGAGGGWRVNM